MSDQIDTEEERELRELLPFYVNGTLEGDELAAVKAYLSGSSEARQECAVLEQLRHGIKGQQQVNSPGELGLKRLQREMAKSENPVANDISPVAANTNTPRSGNVFSWRTLAIAASLALAITGTFSVTNWPGDQNGMELASGKSDAVLQVTFRPLATEQGIRTLLLDTGTSITDGPSALGVYRLRLTGKSDDQAIAGALEKLRQRRDLVDTAERQ